MCCQLVSGPVSLGCMGIQFELTSVALMYCIIQLHHMLLQHPVTWDMLLWTLTTVIIAGVC